MKIDKLQMTAVIPVQQYGNIQPSIEILVDGNDKHDVLLAREVSEKFVKDLFSRYSEKGGLTEHDIVLSKLTRKSFNEEGINIEFEPNGHTYVYNNVPLVGATEFIKKFYKPFDVETISSVLESKWGIPQKIIKDLWDSNGDITSEFGSVIHRTLENYEKFKSYGEIISSQKKEEKNYCLPKHPVLRSIVEEFIELNKDEKGEVITEVLLSDVKSGICGQADRLIIVDKEKKICRIKDYKINIDSEVVDKSYKVLAPFNELPSTKLSKYQLQMSLYANLLQKSGWSVEGLTVFVYEKNWKKFELPILKVI